MIDLNHLNIYLVGGAVRDELLGLPIKERDWVVVGSTPQELLSLGFKSVGKDFPVFLHPETNEEYALARTERKVGPGYKGFEFHTEPSVTLEDDLARRDLTINAIAKNHDGQLVDPFHGQTDIERKLLRHVSPAFVEDPVRILRVARFAARFTEFTVAKETETLMEKMVDHGEVDALVPERVWQEFYKALNEKKPERFFEALTICHALNIIFPDLADNPKAIEALINASTKSKDPIIRFSALLHSTKNIEQFCDRLRTPKNFKDIATHCANVFHTLSESNIHDPEILLSTLEKNDAFRRPDRFKQIITSATICFALTDQSKADEFTHLIESSLVASLNVDIKGIVNSKQSQSGDAIAKTIHQERLNQIINFIGQA